MNLPASLEKKVSILIADDYKLIRETWTYIINSYPHLEVIAETDSGEHAVILALEKRPDIILMDINMKPMDGFQATKELSDTLCSSKIIGVSMYSQPLYAKKMLQMGAAGYVTKNSSKEEMIEAICQVSQGNKYICNEVKSILSAQVLEDVPNRDISILSHREAEIAELVRHGRSSSEIAEQLKISVKTVEVHRYNILRKLNVKNSAALVNFINKAGIC